MLLSFIFAVISLLFAGVAAQDFPEGFDPGVVDQDQRSSWCTAQTNTCPDICGGYASQNRCDSSKLTYSCKCANGTEPDVGKYLNTLPTFICNENYKQCIADHPDDRDGQKACKEDQKSCGTLNATASSSTSATPTGTSTTTLASLTLSPSASGETEAPSETSAAAAATMQLAQNYSVASLATVFLGIFGFLL